MSLFQIPAGPIVGEIKEEIKDAILDGKIRNDKQEAYELLIRIAEGKGLEKPELSTTTKQKN
jgi:hypothetical protein